VYCDVCRLVLSVDVAKLILDDLMSDVGAHGHPLPSRSVRLDSPSPMNPFGSVACLHGKASLDEQRNALETRQLEALEEGRNSSGEMIGAHTFMNCCKN
jgi:hypothetical protein